MASRAERGGNNTYRVGLSARACDVCQDSAARVLCRADSAFLCTACDARVHEANDLASRHERTWLCEVCEQAPATVTCKADAAAICAACDADIHSANPLAHRHERLPLVAFVGPVPPNRPVAAAAGSSLRLPEEDLLIPDSAAEDLLFFSEVDPFLDLDYASSMDGIKKDGTLTPIPLASDDQIDFDFAETKPLTDHSLSISSSEAAVVPDLSQPSVGATLAADLTAARMDREARVMRYREKRRKRRFDKTIRYASRKAYAEARPRIKGRFAKRSEVVDEYGQMYSLEADDEYGIVPSF